MIPIHDKRLREVLSGYGRKGILQAGASPSGQDNTMQDNNTQDNNTQDNNTQDNTIYVLINRLRAVEHENLPADMREAEALLLVADATILPKQGDAVIIENDRWRLRSALRIGEAGSRLFQAHLSSADIQ